MSCKPFSQACENNKEPILQIIRQIFSKTNFVLEIGSGTGQHACYFATHLPHLIWQPTDTPDNVKSMGLWQQSTLQSNLKSAVALDLTDRSWPYENIDAIFTANTLHIMSNEEVKKGFVQIGAHLKLKGLLCIYGPFNYNGTYTSDSNARFDNWLKGQNSLSCIKNIEDIISFATDQNLSLLNDFQMPANNRLLVFQKK